MGQQPIRVLLVDDSQIALTLMSQAIAKTTDIVVVGTAGNGIDALMMIPKVKPDVICTDYYMPRMDGLELTKNIMANYRLPILVVSGRLNVKTSQEVFQIIAAGAVDCIEKPSSFTDETGVRELLEKIRLLSKVLILRTVKKKSNGTVKAVQDSIKAGMHRFVIIGASTGGPSVLIEILSQLPANFPAPIVCIQHISLGFQKPFVDWLKLYCKMKVEIIASDTYLHPGVIYIPKENLHFEMKTSTVGTVTSKLSIHRHRPSITVGMQSVAKQIGREAIGILLTGIGDDGAQGLKEMKDKGALTIAQSEDTCAVFGMPKEAIAMEGASLILDPDSIAKLLLRLFARETNLRKP